MYQILIAGDSWGLGEWAADQINVKILHKGLEFFLQQQGHCVKNISIDGGSNNDVLNSLAQETDHYDFVFVFVTDTHRDIPDDDFWVDGFQYQDYVNRHRHVLRQYIHKLENLGRDNIYLLGGLTKLDDSLVENKTVTVAIRSVLELIIPNCTQFELLFRGKLHLLRNKNTARKLSKTVVDSVYHEEQILSKFMAEPILNPDGQHPNRYGHQLIYNFLKEKYKL